MNISPTLRDVIDDRNSGRSIYPQTDPGHSPADELALQQAIESPEVESHVIEPPEVHEGLSQSISGGIGNPDQPHGSAQGIMGDATSLDSLDFDVPAILANTGGGGGNDFFDRAGSGSRGDFFTNRGGAQIDPNTGRGIPGTGRGNFFDNARPRRNFFEGGGRNANWRAHWTGAGGQPPSWQQNLANAPAIQPFGEDQLLGQGDFEDAGPLSRGDVLMRRRQAMVQRAIQQGLPMPTFGVIPQGLFNRPALVQSPSGALRHNIHRRFSHGKGPHPWKRSRVRLMGS